MYHFNGKLDDSDPNTGRGTRKYSGGRVNPLDATIARQRLFLVRLVSLMDQRRLKKTNTGLG